MFFERYTWDDWRYYFNFRFGDWIIFKSLWYSTSETRDLWIENAKILWKESENYVVLWKTFELTDWNWTLLCKSAEFTDKDECEVIIRNTAESIWFAPIIDN